MSTEADGAWGLFASWIEKAGPRVRVLVEWLLLDPERVDRWCKSQRWSGWREEVRPLSLDTAISSYPFPWSEEGEDSSRVSRKPAPAAEVIAMAFRFARELEDPSTPGPHLTKR